MTGLRYYNPNQLSDDDLVAGFIARQREMDDILDVIRNQPDSGPLQHMLILGERGMGKTTLGRRILIEVARDPNLGPQWQPVGFAEESYRVTSLGKFWLETLAHLSHAVNDTKWQDRADDLRRNEPSDERMAARARDLLTEFRQESGRRLLLFVENIDEIFGQMGDKQDIARLRADLQSHDDFMIIGTAVTRFPHIDDYGKPFYQFFRILNVRGLNQAETLELVDFLAKKLECPALSRDQLNAVGRISAIRTITGGNPRLLQLTARLVAQSPTGTAMDDLERLIDEQTPYFKSKVDALPGQQREIVQALAGLWEPASAAAVADLVRLSPSQVSAQFRKLEQTGFVAKLPSVGKQKTVHYEVSARLYSLYFSIRSKASKRERIENLLDFLVNLYGEASGRSILRSAIDKMSGINEPDSDVYNTILAALKYSDKEDMWGFLVSTGKELCLNSSRSSELANKKIRDGIKKLTESMFYGMFTTLSFVFLLEKEAKTHLIEVIDNENHLPRDFIKFIRTTPAIWEIVTATLSPLEALNLMKRYNTQKMEPIFIILQEEAGLETHQQALEIRNAVAEVKSRRERLKRGEPPVEVFSKLLMTPD